MKRIINFLKYNSRKKIILAIVNIILHKFYLIVNKKFMIKKIHNYKMMLPCKDPGISMELIKYQEREMDQKFLIDSFLKKNMKVYDIGANLGYYSCMMSKIVGDEGSIFSFEPIKENINILKENILLNNLKNIKIFNLAISNKNEFKKIYKSRNSNLNTFNKIEGSMVTFEKETQEVESVTLERAYELCSLPPDLIRMDIEGHEVEVLGSANDFIKKYHFYPIITFEVHRAHYKNNSIAKPLKNLIDLGYKIKMISSSMASGSEIIENYQYKPTRILLTDSCERKIYENISFVDLIKFIEQTGGVRSVCLVK